MQKTVMGIFVVCAHVFFVCSLVVAQQKMTPLNPATAVKPQVEIQAEVKSVAPNTLILEAGGKEVTVDTTILSRNRRLLEG